MFLFLISICVQCNLIVPTITHGSGTAFETAEESISPAEESVRGFQSSYNFQRKLFQHKNPLQIVHGILEATKNNPLIHFARPQVFAGKNVLICFSYLTQLFVCDTQKMNFVRHS